MVGWQVTAKTIYCDAVDDEVTLLIYKDLTARCTGCKKYSEPDDITRKMVKQKIKQLKRPIKCGGEDCIRVMEYKEKILTEEMKP
jgi:hypothetical protein